MHCLVCCLSPRPHSCRFQFQLAMARGPPDDRSGISFVHPRHPHTGQLWFASIATLVYAIAVPGLLSIHNPLAAAGWGVACLLCFCWALLLRQENKYRSIENLNPMDTADGLDPYGATSSGPSEPLSMRSSLHSQPLLTAAASLPSSQLFQNSAFPCFISKATLVLITVIGLGLLAFAGYLFGLAGVRAEPLNGTSHWLSAIAFVAAAKSAGQLGWRMKKVRNTFASLTLFLRESSLPLP